MTVTKQHVRLLLANQAWASEVSSLDPETFARLSIDQSPEFLWIGCSDSRVPAEQVTGAKPGEIFVHRNIANLVLNSDVNVMSVLQYAVEVLKVPHVIVCGHYGCGGVRAAVSSKDFGFINMWIRNIKDMYLKYETELTPIRDPEDRVNRLVECSVKEQVMNLAKTTIIQKAWKYEQRPMIHGWVFDIKTGLLKPMITLQSAEDIPQVYRYALDEI